MFYQVEAVGGEKRAATPLDCQWYKMYLEFPMVNVPKFHVVFRRRFRLPYAQFIQVTPKKTTGFYAGVAGIATFRSFTILGLRMDL